MLERHGIGSVVIEGSRLGSGRVLKKERRKSVLIVLGGRMPLDLRLSSCRLYEYQHDCLSGI